VVTTDKRQQLAASARCYRRDNAQNNLSKYLCEWNKRCSGGSGGPPPGLDPKTLDFLLTAPRPIPNTDPGRDTGSSKWPPPWLLPTLPGIGAAGVAGWGLIQTLGPTLTTAAAAL